ncbi:crotonase/enoyl-CoA hydratase family protein [Marinobacter zhanjiangensis]|uniref:Enoyl-CoA hydratase n=1 Tax=Marinobacter zhanjiangensis TaxID=578215 RepID=A0ABQ3ARL6_9GAMM|nr:crotonase/enoyl-CoA hydratase family protein [Marinobacter zhanjiangensis]GGY63208.1 enoyl-CoA hydratase [Marinobacter zhanjiangensis]
MAFESISYSVADRVATIMLNRPESLNAIDANMPSELAQAVDMANRDKNVHVVVLTGAGRSFCSGYDLKHYAQTPGANEGQQEMPWDPMVDFDLMYGNTEKFMSLWRSNKPTIAKVNGYAVAGGSDIALCCDLVVMTDEGKIGYPPARVWGIPTPAMWVFRLGAEKAKRMLFTGDLINGQTAKDMGLVLDSVPADQLDEIVDQLADRIKGVPRNQLMMSKLMINSAFDNMGLKTTQMFASLFDGVARHSPEGVWFKERAEEVGFKQAVQERDSGDPIAPDVSR